MDVDTTADIVDALVDAELGVEEGGELECFRFSLSLLGQVQSSTGYTVSAKLLIHTDTGTIIIGTQVSDPVTLSELVNTIGCLMSDMDSILQDIGSKGDDE